MTSIAATRTGLAFKFIVLAGAASLLTASLAAGAALPLSLQLIVTGLAADAAGTLIAALHVRQGPGTPVAGLAAYYLPLLGIICVTLGAGLFLRAALGL